MRASRRDNIMKYASLQRRFPLIVSLLMLLFLACSVTVSHGFSPNKSLCCSNHHVHRPTKTLMPTMARNTINRHATTTTTSTTQLHVVSAAAVAATTTSTTAISTVTIIIWAIGHVLGGLVGAPIAAKATNPKTGWYNKLDLPPWTPPSYLFAPVWVTLYALMGIAASRVAILTSTNMTKMSFPIKLWFCHYMLNLSWPTIFFGYKELRLGMIHNCVQVLYLGGIIIPLFYSIDSVSSILLLPYLIWSIFATALNVSICFRNPTKNGYNAAKFEVDLAQLQQDAAVYAGI